MEAAEAVEANVVENVAEVKKSLKSPIQSIIYIFWGQKDNLDH